MRWVAPVLVAVALSAGAAGCASRDPRTADCTPPPGESALLRDYAHDPVLAVTPAGAHRVDGGVRQIRACKFLDMEDTTVTSATLHMTLSHDYDEAALRSVYDPVATRHGWRADSWAEPTPTSTRSFFLSYCRTLHGVTSALTVGANHNPGAAIYITIEATPNRRSCDQPRPTSG